MTNEQKAAFINSQIAMFYGEMEIMKAENVEREQRGYSPANGPEQWTEFYKKWEPVLGYNAVISYFKT